MSAGKDCDWNTPPSATGARPRLTVATCQFPAGHDIAANRAHIVRLIKHMGRRCRRDTAGLVLNALADDAAQDRFFAMVRRFRAAASDGSLHAPHQTTADSDGGFVAAAKQA